LSANDEFKRQQFVQLDGHLELENVLSVAVSFCSTIDLQQGDLHVRKIAGIEISKCL
jgi:hypothetical protein